MTIEGKFMKPPFCSILSHDVSTILAPTTTCSLNLSCVSPSLFDIYMAIILTNTRLMLKYTGMLLSHRIEINCILLSECLVCSTKTTTPFSK